MKRESAKDQWRTPPWLFYQAQHLINMPFSVDICSNAWNTLCPRFFTYQDNALTQDSWGGGVGYMNPPYSRIGEFSEAASEHSVQDRMFIAGMMIHDESTSWWQKHVEGKAIHIFKPDGRISFIDLDGNPISGNPGPTAIVLWAPWRVDTPSESRFIRNNPKTRRRKAIGSFI